MSYDVIVLTEDRYESPTDLDWYNLQVLLEDELVVNALRQQGLNARRLSWSNKEFDWADTKAVLLRTTWDYFDRIQEFNDWLDKVQPITRFINPVEILRWNMDKHYLLDLQERGVNTVTTHILKKGSLISLKQLMQEFQWSEAILKPAISGAARHTYRLNIDAMDDIQLIFEELITEEDFMLQPFQRNICTSGELSLMVINGKYTHAVQKVAKTGDFRVQDDHGGTVHPYRASEEEIIFAEKAIAACHPTPFYARVDLVRDNNDELAIMELELIEPEMFFRFNKLAASELAKAVRRFIIPADE